MPIISPFDAFTKSAFFWHGLDRLPFWTMLKNIKIGVHCTQRHPLEGGGRQTVNTRSTFGEALKYFGYNGTNELCGRSMTSKLSVHEPNGLFHCYKDIGQKVHFYGQTLSNWDFCLGESHEILANIGFKYEDLRSVKSNMAKICQKLLPHLSQSCLHWVEPYCKIVKYWSQTTKIAEKLTSYKGCRVDTSWG